MMISILIRRGYGSKIWPVKAEKNVLGAAELNENKAETKKVSI
jgi:hypothetical protein